MLIIIIYERTVCVPGQHARLNDSTDERLNKKQTNSI